MNSTSVHPSEDFSLDLHKRFEQEESSIKNTTLVLQLFSGLQIATLTSLSFFCFAPGSSLGFAIAMGLSSITEYESYRSSKKQADKFFTPINDSSLCYQKIIQYLKKKAKNIDQSCDDNESNLAMIYLSFSFIAIGLGVPIACMDSNIIHLSRVSHLGLSNASLVENTSWNVLDGLGALYNAVLAYSSQSDSPIDESGVEDAQELPPALNDKISVLNKVIHNCLMSQSLDHKDACVAYTWCFVATAFVAAAAILAPTVMSGGAAPIVLVTATGLCGLVLSSWQRKNANHKKITQVNHYDHHAIRRIHEINIRYIPQDKVKGLLFNSDNDCQRLIQSIECKIKAGSKGCVMNSLDSNSKFMQIYQDCDVILTDMEKKLGQLYPSNKVEKKVDEKTLKAILNECSVALDELYAPTQAENKTHLSHQ